MNGAGSPSSNGKAPMSEQDAVVFNALNKAKEMNASLETKKITNPHVYKRQS